MKVFLLVQLKICENLINVIYFLLIPAFPKAQRHLKFLYFKYPDFFTIIILNILYIYL